MDHACDKCNKIITNRHFLVCAICELNAHIECVNITDKRFYLMTPNRRDNWKCSQCQENTNKEDSSSSPINTSTSTLNDSQVSTHAFVTQRKKVILNISTENSFNLLLNDDEEGDQSLTLNRSCPDLNPFNRVAFEELQQKNNYLQEQLASADNEVANTLSENYALKKKIVEYENKIKHLSSLFNKSPMTINNTSKRSTVKRSINQNKSLNRKKLDFSPLEPLVTPSNRKKALFTKNRTNDGVNAKLRNQNNECEPQNNFNKQVHNIKIKDTTSTTRHKLWIVGEKRLSGLSAAILDSRRGKWNDVYATFGFTMQNATSSQIQEYCCSIENNISEGDVVILGIGSHDSNPELLHKNVCIILSKLSKATIYLLPVLHNPCLNEKTLNNHLKLWSKTFKNCTYIDVKQNRGHYHYRKFEYFHSICSTVNLILDSRAYKMQYTCSLKKACSTFIKYRNLNKHYSDIKKANQRDSKVINEPKKGTIPYYFKMITENSNDKVNFFRSSKDSNTK